MLAQPHVAEPPALPPQTATNDEEKYYSEMEEEKEREEEQSEFITQEKPGARDRNYAVNAASFATDIRRLGTHLRI